MTGVGVRRFAALAFTFLACGLLSAQVGRAADPDRRVRALAAAAGQRDPVMRIGLDDLHAVRVSSRGPFRVVDPSSGESVWKPEFRQEVVVVAEGGPEEEVPSVFRVQAGAFAAREAAEKELRRLQDETGAPGIVRHNPDRGNWRVRLGRADDRLALNPLMERLRALGLQQLWIAEEPAQELTGVSLRLVDGSYQSLATGLRRLILVPASKSAVRIEDKTYRGVVELRVTAVGTVRPINWVGLEAYLLGVVPAEMGPEVWPELAALQAQSVAARTYAWANRGQFEEEGFDLCATPRCQVYKGESAEHPLTDRAIAATRGQVLTWDDEPIDALYTATCGGHTENGGEIFPDVDRPYLTGVPCRAENEAMASLRATVRGSPVEPLRDEAGSEVTRDWMLLESAGVIRPRADRATSAAELLDAQTLRNWTATLAERSGLPAPAGPSNEAGSLGRTAVSLLSDLGWTERAEVLLSRHDLPALLRDPEAAALPPAESRALAYLVWIEGLRPFADGSLHAAEPPTRARLVPALARIGETYEAFGLEEAVVAGVKPKRIRLVKGRGEIRLAFSDRPALFGLTGGKSVPAENLEIWPGDRVRYRRGGGGTIDFLELMPPVKGASDDRSAAVYSWNVRKTRREIEAAVNRRVAVGRLKDLQIVRRGVSGRVVELKVVGTDATTVVRGFDVRRLLGLRESLTVIEIQRDSQGKIKAVVFAGKGWGHGVGMCQVGAYGMALRGAGYREILAHYYRGARLSRVATGAR